MRRPAFVLAACLLLAAFSSPASSDPLSARASGRFPGAGAACLARSPERFETQSAEGSWRRLGPARAVWGPTAIFDPVGNRMVTFGGAPLELLGNSTSIDDTWELTLSGSASWTGLAAPGSGPHGRNSTSSIYDPVRHRMIVFGGAGTSTYNDVWALPMSGASAWTNLTPSTGPAPVPRAGHSAIYDSVRDRMIVFGGGSASDVDLNDVWALSLGPSPTWTQLTPSGSPPIARGWHAAIYDPVRDRMIIFAGWRWATSGSLSDVWALSLSGTPTWTQLSPSGSVGVRNSHSAIYDPVGDRMVSFGGYADPGSPGLLTVLSLSGSPAWTTETPGGTPPSVRDGSAIVYDTPNHRMVVYAGGDVEFGKAWAVTLGPGAAWSPIVPVGTPPQLPSPSTRLIHDTARDRMLLIFLPDVWAQDLSGEPTWTKLVTAGTPPWNRDQWSAIYDPQEDRVLIFGGYATNDVWSLSLSGTPTWSEITPSGTLPPSRWGHTAIYDPVRDRMIVYGGSYGSWTDQLADVWALSLGVSPAWTELTPLTGSPVGRDGHTAIYDPVGDRMVVFGGHEAPGVFRRDVWSFWLVANSWSEITPTNTLPYDQVWMTAVYDSPRQRMLVFGGNFGPIMENSNQLWSFSLSGPPTWTQITPSGFPPPERQHQGAFFDPVRDRMIVYGGFSFLNHTDTWAFTPGASVSVEDPGAVRAGRLALAAPSPNPARGASRLEFTLPGAGRVALDIFDAQGRRVRRLLDEERSAGPHAIRWAGDDDRGRAAGGGLYFARLTAAGEIAVRKVVRVE